MTSVRAYAHHGPVPAGFQVSPIAGHLPGRDDPLPLAQYWCELVTETIVNAPAGAPVGYGADAAAPPDEWRWDIGYAPSAADFHVGQVCILLVGASRNDYDYVVVSPAGERLQVPAGLDYVPMTPMPQWGDPDAPFEGLQGCWGVDATAGKGIWLIEVYAKDGVGGVPVNGYWANEVSNVQLGSTPDDGYLALQFTGDEVPATSTTTTTPAPTTTTTTTPAPTTTTTTTPAPTTTTTTTPAPTTTTTTTTTTPAPTTTTTTTPAPTTTTTTTPAPTTTTTTTPAPTTTTTTTTPAPTTTTTTTTTTPAPTTTTTTTPPPRRDLGLLGVTALLLALVLTAAAAINLFIWACSGYFRVGLVVAGLILAFAALAVIPVWVILWWDGSVVRTLADWVARLAAGTPIIAAVFAVFGNFNCAGGALILAGLFGIMLAAVHLANRVAERRAQAQKRLTVIRWKLRRRT